MSFGKIKFAAISTLTLVDFHVIARNEVTKQSKEQTEEGLQEIASLCSQ
jgi:hypothetical protein